MKKAMTTEEMIKELKHYIGSDFQDYPEEKIKQMYEEFWRKMCGSEEEQR